MRNLIFVMCSVVFAGGCAGVTSPTAEQVMLYQDESALSDDCIELGEVTASVCANTTPCPAEVMKKEIREKAFFDYDADTVLLINTTISGTDIVGYGVAYRCNSTCLNCL